MVGMVVFAMSVVSVSFAQEPAKPVAKSAATKAVTKPRVKVPVPDEWPVEIKHLVNLKRAEMSDEIILGEIAKTDLAKYGDVGTLAIKLKKDEGFSNRLIEAMMGLGRTSVPAVAPAANVVEDVKPIPAPKNAIGEVVLPDGAEIRLRLIQAVSSATAKVDDKIRLEAVDGLLVNGRAVIAQGASAVGTITEAQNKKSFGRRGHLNFTIDVVKAVDGQNIRLRTSTKKVEGDESYVKAGVVTYLTGPFGALVKGKDVVVEAGTEYTIYIDGERRINLAAAK